MRSISMLFNIYVVKIFQLALHVWTGIKVNGKRFNNIQCADDNPIVGNDFEDVQDVMDRVSEVSKLLGLRINISRIKMLTISKK